MEEKILSLLISFLGEYSKQCGDWYSFNCPCCAEENFSTPDGKYNLEVRISPLTKGCGGYHCWKCSESNGTKGTLFKLFLKYAPQDIIDEFKKLVMDFRQSKKFELIDNEELLDEFSDISSLGLPNGFTPLDSSAKQAYEYVKGRGITDKIITKFKIGYVSNNVADYSLRNRVYIPSYDFFGNLTYWVGRDYTGRNKQKSKNPKISKTSIVFNEGLINWYEPITLVEGPFDHIVVPNSIPLLGKNLNEDNAVFDSLVKRSKSLVKIFLDDDAIKEAIRIYKFLENNSALSGRVRIIRTPEGYDPSLIFEEYGYRGIIEMLCSDEKLSEYELAVL